MEYNLLDLCARLHRGAYRAKPSRRVYIPKADGRHRLAGVEVMNAIDEVDFLGFS